MKCAKLSTAPTAIAAVSKRIHVTKLTEDGPRRITARQFRSEMDAWFDDVAFKHHGGLPDDGSPFPDPDDFVDDDDIGWLDNE